MPSGSSIRSLDPRSLKSTRGEIDQIFRVGSISWPIAQYYYSFDLDSLNWKKCMAKFKKKINFSSSFIEQRLYLAISCWAKVGEETRPKISSSRRERGNKRCLRSQRKYVQFCQQSQGVEYAGRQLCQVVILDTSESNNKWNRSNSQGWLNLTPHCPPPLELWL